MIFRSAKAAVLSLMFAAPLAAQTDITSYHTLTQAGVVYQQFTVTTAGVFDLFTTSALGPAFNTPFDPYLYLFKEAGTAGALVGADDDGCFSFLSQCGEADSFANSILNDIALDLGTYTVAVGGYDLNVADARDGLNDLNTYEGPYALRLVSSETYNGTGVALGVASFDSIVTPEPASFALVGVGLAVVGAAVRRRRR